MASKIPVGVTIARAYGFAFGNIVNNLGAIWIPVAILYGLLIAFSKPYSAAMVTMVSQDPQAVLSLMPYIFLGYAILFVLLTAQVAALTKEALGLRTGSAWLQFPFGAPTWRLLLAYLALFMVMMVLYVACFLVALILAAAAGFVAARQPGGASPAIIGVFAVLLVVAIFCAFFYCITRLSFLMAPVAVAEGRRTLQRSWELTRGNFWRIFVVLIAIFIPFIVLEFAYIFWMLGSSLLPPEGLGAGSPGAVAAWQEQQRTMMMHSLQRTQDYWYIAYPVGLAVALVFYGLYAGASAFAYRGLTARKDSPEHGLKLQAS